MAKRKTPKVKNLKPEKITNEQLDRLQKSVNTISKAQLQIGVFQTNIHQLLHNIAGLNDRLVLLQEEFNEQYGTSDVNIDDGKINYNGETN